MRELDPKIIDKSFALFNAFFWSSINARRMNRSIEDQCYIDLKDTIRELSADKIKQVIKEQKASFITMVVNIPEEFTHLDDFIELSDKVFNRILTNLKEA